MTKLKFIPVLIVMIFLGILFYTRSQKPSLIPNSAPAPSAQNGNAIQVFTTGLEIPWALAPLPSGDFLVTERPGRVRTIDKNGKLQKEPVLEIKDVKTAGESGVHGITIHPDFQKNNFVYIYYTYDDQKTLNRVVRYKLENNQLQNQQTIVSAIPGSHFHDGGRIKFGPDKFLYITTGDSLNPSLAQDTNSLAGKILRVTDEGKPAPGNPFGNEVFSYGHRNPQGIAFGNQGQLWETEHGPSANDEVNLIEAGKNYGWPEIQGNREQTGMVSPKTNSGNDTWAPAGAAIFKNTLFFAGLRGTALFKLQLDKEPLSPEVLFKDQYGRIRDVVLAPDNFLYITTSNRDGRGSPSPDDDKIIRLDPRNL